MTTLLQINTSLYSENGQSSKLTGEFVAAWQARHPEGRVVRRDLAADPLPHLTAERFLAFRTPANERTPEQQAAVADSDALIAELKSADVVVLGLPMYNFGIPSTLKSYIDHIGRAGVTFRYTEKGPEGLIGDRKVYVLVARDGRYLNNGTDPASEYLRTFFGFIGIRDLEFIYAEGLAYGEDARRDALAGAHRQIAEAAA